MFRQDGPIVKKSTEFAIKIIKYCRFFKLKKTICFFKPVTKIRHFYWSECF